MPYDGIGLTLTRGAFGRELRPQPSRSAMSPACLPAVGREEDLPPHQQLRTLAELEPQHPPRRLHRTLTRHSSGQTYSGERPP